MPRVRAHHLKVTRDAVMFAIGAVMLANESASGLDRPNIIMAATTLMGVSAYLAGTRVVREGS